MARVKKTQPDLNSIFFATPEQRVLRLLLSEPTTAFSPRVICSRLKGVRGLGGAEGLAVILGELHAVGLIDFVDNHRAVRIQDENTGIRILSKFLAICELESLRNVLMGLSTRGILCGTRATGNGATDSDYDLFVVSDTPEEVKKAASRHPMGRGVGLTVWTSEMFAGLSDRDDVLNRKLTSGILLWGPNW